MKEEKVDSQLWFDKRFEKVKCGKCGIFCYRICRIGRMTVCVDCFNLECKRRFD